MNTNLQPYRGTSLEVFAKKEPQILDADFEEYFQTRDVAPYQHQLPIQYQQPREIIYVERGASDDVRRGYLAGALILG